MKKSSFIAFVVCTLYSVLCTPIFAQDYARLSERTIQGTARYTGFGGAMTAIGGDPTSVLDNPGGLGLYRRAEVLLTLGGSFDRTRQLGSTTMCQRNTFSLPQASVVFSIPTFKDSSKGILFHNIMLSYHRLHSFNRTYRAEAANAPSLGALLANKATVNWDIPFCTDPTASNTLFLEEGGYVNQFAFHWAMNISEQWYLGFGFQVQSYMLASDAVYLEQFDTRNDQGVYFANQNKTKLTLSGTSCNFSAGLIYRPLSWLRLGVGIQTPTLGSLRTYTSGTLSAQTDSLRHSYAPDLGYSDRDFHMPLHLSSSVAFQVGAYALFALQYDYTHAKFMDDVHSLRVGFEVVPVLGMYINGGYVYESSFKPSRAALMDYTFDRQDTYSVQARWNQYASLAVGYRGHYMLIQAAYQFRWQQTDLFAHEEAAPYNNLFTNTHRIVLTIGWHQN